MEFIDIHDDTAIHNGIRSISGFRYVAPMYIFVMGGFCVGKSHFIRNILTPGLDYLSRPSEPITVPVFDVDHKMRELGYTSYSRDELTRARNLVGGEINVAQASKKHMICTGLGSNTARIVNNLWQASQHGYSIHLILIHGSNWTIEQNNYERRKNGDRPIDDIDMLFEAAHMSRTSYDILKELDMVSTKMAIYNHRTL